MNGKRILLSILAGAVLPLVLLTSAMAQRGMGGMGGWEPGSRYNRMYDPKTVETVRGEVISVDKISPRKGMSYGLHVVLKTDKEEIPVHLGPGWYLEKQDLKIGVKDTIEVKGSRIVFDGKPALVAAEVKKGDGILKLRNDAGVPAWSRGPRK